MSCSRREFLKRGAKAAAGFALGVTGCTQEQNDHQDTLNRLPAGITAVSGEPWEGAVELLNKSHFENTVSASYQKLWDHVNTIKFQPFKHARPAYNDVVSPDYGEPPGLPADSINRGELQLYEDWDNTYERSKTQMLTDGVVRTYLHNEDEAFTKKWLSASGLGELTGELWNPGRGVQWKDTSGQAGFFSPVDAINAVYAHQKDKHDPFLVADDVAAHVGKVIEYRRAEETGNWKSTHPNRRHAAKLDILEEHGLVTQREASTARTAFTNGGHYHPRTDRVHGSKDV